MFFSSHQLAEVEFIADHIGIIDQGKDDRVWPLGRNEGCSTNASRWSLPIRSERLSYWVEGVEHVVRQVRRVDLNPRQADVDAIVEQAHPCPGPLLSAFPVTLKEIFPRTREEQLKVALVQRLAGDPGSTAVCVWHSHAVSFSTVFASSQAAAVVPICRNAVRRIK